MTKSMSIHVVVFFTVNTKLVVIISNFTRGTAQLYQGHNIQDRQGHEISCYLYNLQLCCQSVVFGFKCYAYNSYTWVKYFSVAKNAFRTKRVSRRISVSL